MQKSGHYDVGWYYINGNNKSPSWSGLDFLYKFLINNKSVGPYGKEAKINEIEIGDIAQLSFDGDKFEHTLMIVNIENKFTFYPKLKLLHIHLIALIRQFQNIYFKRLDLFIYQVYEHINKKLIFPLFFLHNICGILLSENERKGIYNVQYFSC